MSTEQYFDESFDAYIERIRDNIRIKPKARRGRPPKKAPTIAEVSEEVARLLEEDSHG